LDAQNEGIVPKRRLDTLLAVLLLAWTAAGLGIRGRVVATGVTSRAEAGLVVIDDPGNRTGSAAASDGSRTAEAVDASTGPSGDARASQIAMIDTVQRFQEILDTSEGSITGASYVELKEASRLLGVMRKSSPAPSDLAELTVGWLDECLRVGRMAFDDRDYEHARDVLNLGLAHDRTHPFIQQYRDKSEHNLQLKTLAPLSAPSGRD